MDPLIWAILLLVVGLLLAVLELFIPSGGIIGALAAVSLIGAVWMGFKHGNWTGLGMATVALVALPGILSLAFHVWPHTRMGRRLLLDTPTAERVLPDNDLRRSLRSLVGKVGVTQSLMMPSGAVEIEGRSVDAVTEGLAIEAGQPVRVVEVRGTLVVVRPSTDKPAAQDPLAQSIESIGLDPFQDPLA
ncbi:MAG: NfeD family protein [Planctomycetes bacterium]|nr:NfeD family protein [Planctomycetota bacterium]